MHGLSAISERLRRWVRSGPELPGPLDPATEAFCRQKLEALCDPTLLARKVDVDLGTRAFESPGRILVVVSEHDILGTVAGFVAARLVGSKLRLKARHTYRLLRGLKQAFDLSDDDCEILDWSSAEQDDREVLAGIDAVLLAGSEQLIVHYRRVTPAGVRLVEFGPKVSCAAISTAANLGFVDALIEPLIHDVALFGQRVCSSPQFILVDEMQTARVLRDLLLPRLAHLPSLPHSTRLQQRAKAHELELRGRLGEAVAVDLDSTSSWGITVSSALDPSLWLGKGFQLIVGPVATHLDAARVRYRNQLQTLGEWGLDRELPVRGFTHRCAIGRMHERSVLEPHDGMLELAALVRFVSREVTA